MAFYEVIAICLITLGITVFLQGCDMLKNERIYNETWDLNQFKKDLFFPLLFVWVVLTAIALVIYKLFTT